MLTLKISTLIARMMERDMAAHPSHVVRPMNVGVMAVVTGTLLLATQFNARAEGSDCGAVQAAVALQSKTPFRATMANASSQSSASPAAKSETIWINNTLYLSMGGRWVGGPMPPERALVGVTGGNLPFSECKHLPDAVVSGRPTSVYSAKMQSGEHVQLFIAIAGGLLLREVLDEQIMKVTVDFEYTNVRAPALGK